MFFYHLDFFKDVKKLKIAKSKFAYLKKYI